MLNISRISIALNAAALCILLGGCDAQPHEQPSAHPADLAASEDKQTQEPLIIRGTLKSITGEHAYTLTVEDGKTGVFIFEPALPRTDGAMYGAILDAIEIQYPGRTENYVGSPLKPYKLASGTTAIALETENYRYISIPVKSEQPIGGIIGMRFWREIKQQTN